MVVVIMTLEPDYVVILPGNNLVNWSNHCNSLFGNRAPCMVVDQYNGAVSGSWELQHDAATLLISFSLNHITSILPTQCPLLLHVTLPSPLFSSWMQPSQGLIPSRMLWKVGVKMS